MNYLNTEAKEAARAQFLQVTAEERAQMKEDIERSGLLAMGTAAHHSRAV